MEDYIPKEEFEYSCEALDSHSLTTDSVIKEEERYFNDDFKEIVCNQLGFGVDIYNMLIECAMDTESLKRISEDEIKELFPTRMMGTRIKFRTRVSQWQKNEPIIRVRIAPVQIVQSSNNTEGYRSSGLAQILEATPRGQNVLKFYADNGKLLDDHREIIISIIVEYCIDHSMAMSSKDIVTFSKEIGKIFPSEDTRYYYNARGKGLNPIGKLYDKATNARRKMKKSMTVVATMPDAKKPNPIVKPILATEAEREDKAWLLHNREPWKEVLNKWHSTFFARRADVLNGDQNVLENWPILKHAKGFILVESDYAKLFPEKEQILVSKWENFRENVIPFVWEKIKDSESKKLMEKLRENPSTDSTDCILILLLHAVIKPPFVSITKRSYGNKRFKWKPTISEAQNATVLHCTSLSEYKEKFEALKSIAWERNETVQPLLLVIGEDITKLESFYVLHDDILYQLPTFIKSLDILFKFYQITNFKYPSEAKFLYELIESYFFKMNTSCNPNIISLIKYLDDKTIHIVE